MALAPAERSRSGVYTASAGNMAQGVAWNARRLGIPCTVVVPDHAPRDQARGDRAAGREGRHASRSTRWWQVLVEHGYPGVAGLFIHPVSRSRGDRGQRDDRPRDPGGPARRGRRRSSRSAAAASPAASRRRSRACARRRSVFACEVETAAPLAASLAAGEPVADRLHAELRGRHRRQEPCSPRCGRS